MKRSCKKFVKNEVFDLVQSSLDINNIRETFNESLQDKIDDNPVKL